MPTCPVKILVSRPSPPTAFTTGLGDFAFVLNFHGPTSSTKNSATLAGPPRASLFFFFFDVVRPSPSFLPYQEARRGFDPPLPRARRVFR